MEEKPFDLESLPEPRLDSDELYLLDRVGAEARRLRDNLRMRRIIGEVLKADSCAIDAGALRGEVLSWIVEAAPRGRHFAFEPIPRYAEALRTKFPRVEVVNCALGAAPARSSFHHVINIPGWSGLKKQPCPIPPEREVIEVDVMRLDDAIPADVRIDLIKIDVEGGEYNIIEGAVGLLRRCRPRVIFEHARVHAHEYGFTHEMLYDLICKRVRPCRLQPRLRRAAVEKHLRRNLPRGVFDALRRPHGNQFPGRAAAPIVLKMPFLRENLPPPRRKV